MASRCTGSPLTPRRPRNAPGRAPPTGRQSSATLRPDPGSRARWERCRGGHTVQATYDGHPLYTYIGDNGPGQANGNKLDLTAASGTRSARPGEALRRGPSMTAEPNPAQRLHALGQSLWLDSINRVMLRSVSAGPLRQRTSGHRPDPPIRRSSDTPWPPDRIMTAPWRAWWRRRHDAQDLVYGLALEDLARGDESARNGSDPAARDGYVSGSKSPPTSPTTPRHVALARRLPDHRLELPQPPGEDPRDAPGPDRHGGDRSRPVSEST